MRTILVHISIELPDGDDRSIEEIERGVMGNLTGGGAREGVCTILGGPLANADVCVALAEEV